MNDQTEDFKEPVSVQASPAAEGGTRSTAARRPRKRRRYRKTPRATAQTPAVTPETASDETGSDDGQTEVEGASLEAQAEPAQADASETEQDSGEGSGFSTPLQAEGETEPVVATSPGPAPTGVIKKRRHRGGRRHRRRRPEGAVSTETPETAGSSISEPMVTAPPQQNRVQTELKPAPAAPSSEPVPVAEINSNRESSSWPVKSENSASMAMKMPGLDAGRAKKALLAFLQGQREQRGQKRAVLELSGELNTITAATLAVEALGQQQVDLFFFTDSDSGSANRREQARLVASRLGRNLEIKDLRAALTAKYGSEAGSEPSRLRERVQRETHAWLLDKAASQNAMLIMSTNKTERLLLTGSLCAETGETVCPLADLYQTQVYELAKACNIPLPVVDPTRDFALSRTLGLKTAEIDGLLYQMLDVRVSLAKLMEMGLEESKVRALYQQLRQAAQNRKVPVWESLGAFYQPRPWAR